MCNEKDLLEKNEKYEEKRIKRMRATLITNLVGCVWFGYLKNDPSVHFFHQFPRKRELYGQSSQPKKLGKNRGQHHGHMHLIGVWVMKGVYIKLEEK